MANFQDFIETQRHRFSRGGLWLRGQELGRLPASEWENRSQRILVTRLSTYEDTSLSFTHNFLYALIAQKNWYPDLCFLPPAKDREVLAEGRVPWLFGTGSRRSWEDFDLVAVSNSITQELGNWFWFLQKSGLPLGKAARLARPDIPLILMGGANAGSASVFFHPDPPVDGIYVGEDQDQITQLFELALNGRQAGLSKGAILEQLEALPGFYQPDRPRPVKKFNARRLSDGQLYAQMPVNYGEDQAGKAVLAISEGCAGFCSFCNESFSRKPYREGAAPDLLKQALEIKRRTTATKLDLFSFNFNMHREFYPLLEGLLPLFPEIGLKSQRFDSLAEDPTLVEVEKALGKTYFTCGMEGLSERLRRYLNKNLSEQQIRRSVEVLFRANIRELKIFLIATGLEEEADFAEFAQLVQWLKTLRTLNGKTVRIVFSITPIVHFPHTPLEFAPLTPVKTIHQIERRVTRIAEEAGLECRTAASPEEALISDLLLRARGPEFLVAYQKTILEGGFVYEREIPDWFYRHFLKNLAEVGWPEDRLFQAYSPADNQGAPWAQLDLGLKRSFLEYQYAKNQRFEEIEPNPEVLCGKKPQSDDFFWADRFSEQLFALKKQEVELTLACRVSENFSQLSRDYFVSALVRQLLDLEPTLTADYRGWSGSWWVADLDQPVTVVGDDLIRLRFLPGGARVLTDCLQRPEFIDRLNQRLGPGNQVYALTTRPPIQASLTLVSPYPFNAQTYLIKQGLKHVYVKIADGRYQFQFTKEAVKKNVLKSLELSRRPEGGQSLTLVPGQKFDLPELLTRGFDLEDRHAWQRIKVSARISF